MKLIHTLVATSLFAACLATANTAAELGKSLTLVGAEQAGNADGSIPAYSGGLTTAPAGFKAGDSYRPNPYADEKPVLVITQANMEQYKDLLTATTQELLKRHSSYRVDVYPTHRSAAYPKANLDNSIKNASQALSKNDGLTLENVLPGVPFPIPKSGAEAMWNHLLRYQGANIQSEFSNINVDAAGTATLATTGKGFISFPIYENMDKTISPTDIYYRIKLNFTGPARRTGEGLLVQDAADPLVQPRRAWQYLPGQRRVKLAPDLGYDTPNPGSAGASTYDDSFVFTGALDRYDWKLVGKKEMYIPYNTYALSYIKDASLLTTPNHLNPDYLRWEKHRVWVVEAKLKDGKRHIYHQRTFYLDEDSWTAVASDAWDARQQLYRGAFGFLTQSYDVSAPDSTPHMIYDLIAGSYSLSGLYGPFGGVKYTTALPAAQWSPQSLAGSGIR